MQQVNRMLIVVSPAHPTQYAYLKHAFEKEAIAVIFDRSGVSLQLWIERGLRGGAAETAANATSPRTFRGSAGQ